MPPGSGLQVRARAPHSPARSGYACRTASDQGEVRSICNQISDTNSRLRLFIRDDIFSLGNEMRSRFVMCHEWKTGDLLIWHNLSVLHRRGLFDLTTRRAMHRS
jgi:hypothetical protein